MSSTNLVSVIVPVYKVSEYIRKCVESLRIQTYSNIEIILVDDGSPDDCPKICDELSKIDERIVVIHKDNGGLSSARNVGIEIANGEYLAFVDSDDFVTEDYIETLLSACQKNNVKISACGYFEYYSDEKNINCSGESSYIISGDDAIKDIFVMKNDIHVVAWNKLYAKELFMKNGIRYAEGKLHEDVFTTYKLFAQVNRVAYVNKPCYYYVQREGSIMNLNFHPKRLQLLEAVESIKPFVEQKSPVFDQEYIYYVFLNHLTIINSMADSRYEDRKLFEKITDSLMLLVPLLKNNKYYCKKHRLTVLFLKSGMRIFYLIRKVYKIIG